MRKRLIPVLLVDKDRRLVKTVRFGERTYIGDPFNVVRLFNEKEVDEIVVLDVDAGPLGRTPDLGFLAELASECFMPLAYGGGIREMVQCERLNRIGVEKFIFGHSAFDSALVRSACAHLGSQAVTACVDYIGSGDSARCVTASGRTRHALHPLAHARALQQAGVGEILLQSVDRDGHRTGMDLATISAVAPQLEVPLVAVGGAGELRHLVESLHVGASAAGSGSAFSFIGRLRAVLVTYPSPAEISEAILPVAV